MLLSRKNFLKTACIGSACGFGSLMWQSNLKAQESNQPTNKGPAFMQEWISGLLYNIDENLVDESCRKIMKPCANAHYQFLEMDKALEPYRGNISLFLQFINETWGWKIDYNQQTGIILADENKAACVCPMVNQSKGVRSAILCYCSEGFAEKMFSAVVGHPVKATVISSIHRGDKSCIYQININNS